MSQKSDNFTIFESLEKSYKIINIFFYIKLSDKFLMKEDLTFKMFENIYIHIICHFRIYCFLGNIFKCPIQWNSTTDFFHLQIQKL